MLDDLNKTIGANKTNILSLLSIWEHWDFRRAVDVFDVRHYCFMRVNLGNISYQSNRPRNERVKLIWILVTGVLEDVFIHGTCLCCRKLAGSVNRAPVRRQPTYDTAPAHSDRPLSINILHLRGQKYRHMFLCKLFYLLILQFLVLHIIAYLRFKSFI